MLSAELGSKLRKAKHRYFVFLVSILHAQKRNLASSNHHPCVYSLLYQPRFYRLPTGNVSVLVYITRLPLDRSLGELQQATSEPYWGVEPCHPSCRYERWARRSFYSWLGGRKGSWWWYSFPRLGVAPADGSLPSTRPWRGGRRTLSLSRCVLRVLDIWNLGLALVLQKKDAVHACCVRILVLYRLIRTSKSAYMSLTKHEILFYSASCTYDMVLPLFVVAQSTVSREVCRPPNTNTPASLQGLALLLLQ